MFLVEVNLLVSCFNETNNFRSKDEIIELILNCKNEYLNKISNFDNSNFYR